MKSVTKHYRIMAALIAFTAGALGQGEADISLATAELEGRLNSYIEKRSEIKAGLPILSDSATPEEINNHRTALLEAVRKERKDAKEGDILTPTTVAAMRSGRRRWIFWFRANCTTCPLGSTSSAVL